MPSGRRRAGAAIGSAATRSSNAQVRARRRRRRPRPTRDRGGRRASSSRLATKSRWPNVSAVTSAFTRVRREDVRRPPSGRRSARSARRPRRGRRPRRTSPPPRPSSGSWNATGSPGPMPRARSPVATRRASASTSPSVPRYGLRSERTVNGCSAASCSPAESTAPSDSVVPEPFATYRRARSGSTVRSAKGGFGHRGVSLTRHDNVSSRRGAGRPSVHAESILGHGVSRCRRSRSSVVDRPGRSRRARPVLGDRRSTGDRRQRRSATRS